jgi:hypothetical protein
MRPFAVILASEATKNPFGAGADEILRFAQDDGAA